MRSLKKTLFGVLAAALVFSGSAQANTDLNQVGAFLVYPAVMSAAAVDDTFVDGVAGRSRVGMRANNRVETYLTLTNASNEDVEAHLSFINGSRLSDTDDRRCFECDFNIPLSPGDTELIIVTQARLDNNTPSGGANIDATQIEALDSRIQRTCDWREGFVTVALEDGEGNTIGNNILLGEEVVVNYTRGSAYSMPAVTFQGINVDSDQVYAFDDSEYKAFPGVVAADFIAPDYNVQDNGTAGLSADLFLFTLNFETEIAPSSGCDVIGYDDDENFFSNSIQFDCWQHYELCEDIQAEFCYGFLGADNDDQHGWLHLSCEVDGAEGAVHGAIVQTAENNAMVRRPETPVLDNTRSPIAIGNQAQWARLLYQAMTAGDDVTFTVVPNPGPDNL